MRTGNHEQTERAARSPHETSDDATPTRAKQPPTCCLVRALGLSLLVSVSLVLSCQNDCVCDFTYSSRVGDIIRIVTTTQIIYYSR